MDGWQFGPAQQLRQAFILDDNQLGPIHWYRPGKSAAVIMSVDDIFPGTSQSAYEAGGDLERGALGRLLWLLERHAQLQLTLFVTPDWRRISAVPHRIWRHVPWLRDRMYLVSVLPKGTMDIRNHPQFVAFLNAMPRTEIALQRPAPRQRGSRGLRGVSAPGQRRMHSHADRSHADLRRIRFASRAGTSTARMDLQPSATTSMPGCGDRMGHVCARYFYARLSRRQDSDVGVERREHVIS